MSLLERERQRDETERGFSIPNRSRGGQRRLGAVLNAGQAVDGSDRESQKWNGEAEANP